MSPLRKSVASLDIAPEVPALPRRFPDAGVEVLAVGDAFVLVPLDPAAEPLREDADQADLGQARRVVEVRPGLGW